MNREESAQRRKRSLVFVVEDDRTIASAVCELLRDAGYAPRSASTLEEATRYLRELVPDCLVLDLSLPDGEADVLLAQLTRGREAPPTVLLSADPRARQLATRFAVAYVAKPFDADVLLAAIETALQCAIRPREVRSA